MTLAQTRAASFGLRDLQFVTRSGYRHLIGRAAGLVISLLVAFSAIVLLAAGVMLGASAAAEMQRRREAIGVLRAFGATPSSIAVGYAVESAAVAAPAACVGLVAGAAVVASPLRHLLGILNEITPPALTTFGLLAAAWAAIVLVVAAATWVPAWRAGRERIVDTLRGGDASLRIRRGGFVRPRRVLQARRLRRRRHELRVAPGRFRPPRAWYR